MSTKLKYELIASCEAARPTAGGNTDPLMSDYKFWSDCESIAKLEREKAKKAMLEAVSNPLQPGVLLHSSVYQLILAVSKPVQKFELEVMIDWLLRKKDFKPHRAYIRECAMKALVDGEPRRTYKVEPSDG